MDSKNCTFGAYKKTTSTKNLVMTQSSTTTSTKEIKISSNAAQSFSTSKSLSSFENITNISKSKSCISQQSTLNNTKYSTHNFANKPLTNHKKDSIQFVSDSKTNLSSTPFSREFGNAKTYIIPSSINENIYKRPFSGCSSFNNSRSYVNPFSANTSKPSIFLSFSGNINASPSFGKAKIQTSEIKKTNTSPFNADSRTYISPYSGFKSSINQNSVPFTSFLLPNTSNNLQNSVPKKTASSLPTLSTSVTEKLLEKNAKKLLPGICYIFNHENFDNKKLERRDGSTQDVLLLKETFEYFKLKVVTYHDLTVQKIQNEISKIQKKDFSKNSCIVIVILSHGHRSEQICAKDGSYSIDDDILFKILKNPTLDKKLKLFVVQACKGSIDLAKYQKDALPVVTGEPSNILKCYSTFEGHASYRDPLKGSIFIKKFCELLKLHGKTKDIRQIVDLVADAVRKEMRNCQIPSNTSTLTTPYIFGDYL